MGRYELLFRVASGGMAEVYAARVLGEAGFQKLVAVKRMLPSLADDEDFVKMFLDEARVAANISSPHVVQTLDLGRDDRGALFIVMELVVGVPLSRIMKEAAKVRRAVPVGMAVELLAQAALGLESAHRATTPIGTPLDIIHRDISPQNILVGVDGRARITDFGVARAVMRMSKTEAGRIKGKFAYCAPEQLRSQNIDQRIDIFALGIVGWEVLAGQRLFVAEHPLATMERVQSMPILPVHTVRSKVPEGVSRVIDHALQRNPEDRLSSAAEFGRQLRRAATDAGLELPLAGDITRFVKAAGGEPLTKMRTNIQVALSQGTVLDSQAIDLVEESSGIASGEGSDTLDTTKGRHRERSEPDLDTSGVSRTPGSLLPPAMETKGPDNFVWKLAALGILGGLLMGGIGYFAVTMSSGPAEGGYTATPLEPRAGAEPAAGADTEAESEAEAESESESEAESESEPGFQADLDFAVDEVDEATPTAMRRVASMSTTTAMETSMEATMEPTMEPTMETFVAEMSAPPVEAVTMMDETSAPDSMRAATTTNPTMGSSMGTLVGVDVFDRELGD